MKAKKGLKTLIFTLILTVIIMIAASCVTPQFELKFEVDGEVYFKLNTGGQEAIKLPDNPQKDGYIFDGWFWDKDEWKKPFTANSLLDAPLSSNMTVYAKLKNATTSITVSFNSNGGSTIESITIEKGESIIFPESPTKEGHLFDGWYTDESFTPNGKVTATTTFDMDTLLYAKWIAHNHDYALTNVDATCKEDGYTMHTCICGDTYKDNNVSKLGHIGGIASCTEKAICDRCHLEYCDALGHNLESNFTTDLEPTCTADGNKSKHCTRCEEKGEITVIDALGHIGGTATCTEKAICDRCHLEYGNLGHNLENDFTIDLEPTCTENGSKSKHCTSCDEKVEITTINALGHMGGTATCTEKTICERCHLEYGDALGHNLESNFTTDLEPTCTADGNKSKHCTRCEEKGEITTINALGHMGGTATCTEKATCDRCHLEYGKALGHIGGTDTCTDKATCDRCHLEYGGLGHKYNEGFCSVCDLEQTPGLSFKEITGGYEVSGLGTVKDNNIFIPAKHNGQTVISVGYAAFFECISLKSIIIPNSVTSIAYGAFVECNSLENISIPDSVTSIGSGAFYKCSSLTSILIPDSVTSIGYRAFEECSSLTSITIPDSVTSIGEGAFEGCSSLTSITIPNSVRSIGELAFGECKSLTSITIPSSVTYIDWYAFNGCSSLTSLTFAEGSQLTSIGTNVFLGCSSLVSITIPSSVTSIDLYAFQNCSNLTSITIPNSVTSIGKSAFWGCSSLTIYAEAASKPSGWASNWNPNNRPVIWNYKP